MSSRSISARAFSLTAAERRAFSRRHGNWRGGFFLPPACKSFLCALFWLWSAPGMAAEALPEGAEVRLEAETVISSPIIEGNTVSRYGAESTVVTRKQMEDMNAQDVTSALRRTPGVTISRYNPVGSFGGMQGGGIFIRGMGASRPGGELATLYDGVSLNNPIFGHPVLDIISIDPAESIEVHKAPQPEVFGNAHAAINMIPKRMREEGFYTNLSGQYGSYNTFVQTAEHGGRQGGLDYYLGQSFKSSDGQREHSSGQIANYFGRLGYDLTENLNLSWFGDYSDNFAHDPGQSGDTLPDGSRRDNGRYGTYNQLHIVSLDNRFDKASGQVKVHYSRGAARWRGEQPSSPGGPALDTDMDWDTWGVKTREAFTPWKGGEIAAGFDYDSLSGSMNNTSGQEFSRQTFEIYSPHAAVSHTFGGRDGWHLTPSAGLRWYEHNEFGSEASPHAGLVLGYKETELHFGYARSVVYPGLNVAVFSQVIVPPLAAGNPDGWKDLSAEIMDHYEAGLSHTFNSLVKADVTVFWDEGKDRYRMYPRPGTMIPAGFDNIDSYRKYGFESTVTVAPSDDLSLFLGAAYLQTDPYDMPFAPDWTVSAGANWRFLKDFRISADALYREHMYTDSWARAVPAANPKRGKVGDAFLVNAKLSYFFDLPWMHLQQGEVFIAAENLTNETYEYAPGYPMPGTTWMFGASLTF